MDAIFNNEQFWQVIGYVIGYVLGGALALGIVTFMSQYAAKWVKQAAYYARQWEPIIEAAVNEPTDDIPAWLEKKFPGSSKYLILIAPPVLRTLADELEKLAAIPAPAALPLLPPMEAVK